MDFANKECEIEFKTGTQGMSTPVFFLFYIPARCLSLIRVVKWEPFFSAFCPFSRVP